MMNCCGRGDRGESATGTAPDIYQISGCSGADIWTAEATISIYQIGFMTLSPVRNHCQIMVVTGLATKIP